MRIAEYKQIDTKLVEETVTSIDENGNELTETITREIPIMGMVYRDMTEEEMAQMESVKLPPMDEEPTIQDLVEALGILTNIVLGEE